MEFYHERRKLLARTTIEAPSPSAAVPLGRKAILVRYPGPRAGRTLSLLERAERAGGRDESGWVLYRIVRDDGVSGGRTPAIR